LRRDEAPETTKPARAGRAVRHEAGNLEVWQRRDSQKSERSTYNQATGFPTQPLGVNAGIREQLNRIKQQAVGLREEAALGMKLCGDQLAKELMDVFLNP
jgi:hypothetical protein